MADHLMKSRKQPVWVYYTFIPDECMNEHTSFSMAVTDYTIHTYIFISPLNGCRIFQNKNKNK